MNSRIFLYTLTILFLNKGYAQNMRDKIFCYDIYSDSLEFSFNDFKTYGINTAEAFRYRLKNNGKVKDSIPFYKITKKNDTAFEIKVYRFSGSAQKKNRKLYAGDYSIYEFLFNKKGNLIRSTNQFKNYPPKNFPSPPLYSYDTTYYFYDIKNNLIKKTLISRPIKYWSSRDGINNIEINLDTSSEIYSYNKSNKNIKTIYLNNNNDSSIIFEWTYNKDGLLYKYQKNFNQGSKNYYSYDSMNRLISESEIQNNLPNRSFCDSTLIEYSYINNKISRKTTKVFKFGHCRRHPEIEIFDTFGNVIQYCYPTYRDTFRYCNYTNYKYSNKKIIFLSGKDEYNKSTYNTCFEYYPNGFLKEVKSIGKYQTVYRYYYKQ